MLFKKRLQKKKGSHTRQERLWAAEKKKRALKVTAHPAYALCLPVVLRIEFYREKKKEKKKLVREGIGVIFLGVFFFSATQRNPAERLFFSHPIYYLRPSFCLSPSYYGEP